ncbi:MAG: hypothetical protein ACREPS_00940 [Rhodanobacteraceae bacterium]
MPGLLFVSLSINFEHILEMAALTSRATETMMPLGAALIVALLTLIPDRSTAQSGALVLIVEVLARLPPRLTQTASRIRNDPLSRCARLRRCRW